jgi:hypothetical protein
MPPQLPATAAGVAAVARTLLAARELIADPGANAGTSVIPADARVYLPELHGAERTVAAALTRLAAAPPRLPHAKRGPRDMRAWLNAAETSLGVTLSAEQRGAVASAAKERVLVLTGGPGTGKTFVVTLAVRLWLQQGLRVRCVASMRLFSVCLALLACAVLSVCARAQAVRAHGPRGAAHGRGASLLLCASLSCASSFFSRFCFSPSAQLMAEGCVASPELSAVPPPSTIHRLLEFIPRSDEGGASSAVERDASALSWEGRFARNAEAR